MSLYDDLTILDHITLPELEHALSAHTTRRLLVDDFTRFSWSVTRHQAFVQCRRRYYLTYYGARRVRQANSKVVSAVWWLKQATGLSAWIGSVIHRMARQAITAYVQGKPVDRAGLTEQALADLTGGMEASQRGIRHNGQWVILNEHLYPKPGLPPDGDQARAQTRQLARALFDSEAFALVLSTPPGQIAELEEEFQSFHLDGTVETGGTKVFAVPDVVIRTGRGRLTIIDWKTGDVDKAGVREQAGVYKLYASHRYKAADTAIRVLIADLAGGAANEPPDGTPPLAEAEALVKESIRQMVALLESAEHNTAAIQDFPLTEDRSLCGGCGFRRACWRHAEIL